MTTLRRLILALTAVFVFVLATPAGANEVWVAPTYQQDIGGLGVGSNIIWPVTPIGAVRLAWAIPGDLETFQSAKLVLIPQVSASTQTLTLVVCPAQSSTLVTSECQGPSTQGFTSVANQLTEIDISEIVRPRIGTPGVTYLAVLAFTTPATLTDHVVGLRFAYTPTPPTGVATLGANTFTGTQTAPAFAGDGAALTNLPLPAGVATLGMNVFSGTQTAPAFVGGGAGLTNLPFPSGAARLNGGNIFAGTQKIGGGNLDMETSTVTTGVLTKNGVPFLHDGGAGLDTFLGLFAGNLTMSGQDNTGIGTRVLGNNTTGYLNTGVGTNALFGNTTGFSNTAVGGGALAGNTTGILNTAIGDRALNTNATGQTNTAVGSTALGFNTSGSGNTAVGIAALASNTAGNSNIAIGADALFTNPAGLGNVAVGAFALFYTVGNYNTAVGHWAGLANQTGSNNVYLGSQGGVADESDTMYLGGTQTRAFAAGIRGTTTGNADAIPVVIDSAGQLGTVSSSRRFKEDIHEMADASRRLFHLRPVTFRYTQTYGNGSKPIQFGLVAEEVAVAFPELAVHNAQGEVETVHYETLSVLLLNEVQRQERDIRRQQQQIDALERQVAQLLRRPRLAQQ